MVEATTYKVIKEYFSDKPVKMVQVFGSFARNEAIEISDIDLIISVDHPVGLLKLAGYKLDLESLLNKKIDLATEPSISPDFY